MRSSWLPALAIYLTATAGLNLLWEVMQLPLYTIWTTGTWAERAFAVVHCTGGDVLIALVTLVVALIATWAVDWPKRHFRSVAVLAIASGIAYTAFSEWLNVYVRQSWAYAEMMPAVTVGTVRIGLSPLAQWLIVPAFAFLATQSIVRWRAQSPPADGIE